MEELELRMLEFSNFFILLNETPIGFFFPTRGLHQGGCLSPFLFFIVGEALSHMMLATPNTNLMKGFCSANGAREITHL